MRIYTWMFLVLIFYVNINIYAQQKQRIESLTIRDCLVQAIRNNLDLKVQSFNPQLRNLDITIAKSSFDPTLTSTYTYSRAETQQNSVLDLSSESNRARFNTSIQKGHLLGGSISLDYNLDYFKDLGGGGGFFTLNPSWTHKVGISVNQPLLKDMGIGINSTNINLARNNEEIAYYAFQNQALATLTAVQEVYLDLVNAYENYELQRQSLRQAKNLYKITEARIKAGSLAAADILDAERNVATIEDGLVVAEKNVLIAEDSLKRLIRPLDTDYYINTRLLPIDRPVFQPIKVDFKESLQYALKNRLDLKQSIMGIKNSSLSIDFQKNQLLPQLDLIGSIEYQGLGGNSPDGFESVVDTDFPTWSVGVSLEIPLGNRSAKSNYKKALLERKQLEAQHRQVQSQVIWDVRNAVRDLDTAYKRVYTAAKIKKLAEKQLANEENKFRAGIIPLFQVQDTEQELTAARISEINTIIDYQKAIVALERAKGALDESLQKYDIQLSTK